MFRQDALENRKMKWQGRAILLPGIPLWLIMLGSIVFITAFLMFIIVGTYSRRVNVSGEVTTWPYGNGDVVNHTLLYKMVPSYNVRYPSLRPSDASMECNIGIAVK